MPSQIRRQSSLLVVGSKSIEVTGVSFTGLQMGFPFGDEWP